MLQVPASQWPVSALPLYLVRKNDGWTSGNVSKECRYTQESWFWRNRGLKRRRARTGTPNWLLLSSNSGKQEHPVQRDNVISGIWIMISGILFYGFLSFFEHQTKHVTLIQNGMRLRKFIFVTTLRPKKRNQVLSADRRLASVWAWPYLPGQMPPYPWDWGWSGRPGSRPACWHQCRCSAAVFSSTLAARDCYLCVSVVSLIVTNSSFVKQLYMHLNTYDWKIYTPQINDKQIPRP